MRASLPKKHAETFSSRSFTYIPTCDFINSFKHIYFNFPQACQRGRLEKREINELTLMFFNYILWNPESPKNSSYYSMVFFNMKKSLCKITNTLPF